MLSFYYYFIINIIHFNNHHHHLDSTPFLPISIITSQLVDIRKRDSEREKEYIRGQ